MLKAEIIGHLGADARVNDVNGQKVINFDVCHSEKYKDQNGADVTKNIWVQCAYWTDRTGIAPYLKKGTQVFVEGIPNVNLYKTNDGKHGASLTLRVRMVQLLGGSGREENRTQQTAPRQEQSVDQYSADDLPF